MTPAPIGPGSPLIAGAALPGGEINDFTDDELNGMIDFSNSPDTLQTFDNLSSNDTKIFISPQDLISGPLPDSPNGSYQDSSSETASTKRAGSSSSPNPTTMARDGMMDDLDTSMDWNDGDLAAFGGDDHTFNFRDTVDSNLDELYMFKDHDEALMDHTFDFESSTTSPLNLNRGQTNMPSPEMPTIHPHSPAKTFASQGKKIARGHQKGPSVGPFDFSFDYC